MIATERNRMVEENIGLVWEVAKKLGRAGDDDAIQDGAIGLMRAAEMFDPGRMVPFSSYAWWWIRGSILAAIGDDPGYAELPGHLAPADDCRQAEAAEAAEHVRAAMARLGARDREYLSMRYGIGSEPHTLVAMGRIHGESHQTVGNRIDAARRRLRAILEAMEG